MYSKPLKDINHGENLRFISIFFKSKTVDFQILAVIPVVVVIRKVRI